ncbi:hypothetical protein [Nocardia wallacei]|nr:hypothetical protein [Nocardia wallacei]
MSRERQAELLGYADAASMRRAARRWSMVARSGHFDDFDRRF